MVRVLVIGASAVAMLAWPAGAAAQAPGTDSVVGGFSDNTTALRGFAIDARSGPAGEQPGGSLSWHFGGGLGPTWSATVTCLSVAGDTAVAGFAGMFRFFGEDTPVAGLVRVHDGAGPDSRQDTFEWAETLGQPGGAPIPGPTECSSYPSTFIPQFPSLSVNDFGDVVITDTTALPSTKDQCKNGGWKAYGIFKNQGDCVSFVATGGRNQPSGP